MNTVTKKTNNPVLIRIADKLVQAQQELDELIVQFSLGKADAKEKFEEIKSDFMEKMHEFRNSTTGQKFDKIRDELEVRVSELENLLQKSTAHSADVFEKQKEQVEYALDRLKINIGKHLPDAFELDQFWHEIEKFKLKLEILRLAFSLKKLKIKESFREKMHDIKLRIERFVSGARGREKTRATKASEFRKEAKEVYVHLRKAIQAL